MQYKTSSMEFEKYGSVYDTPIASDSTDMISRKQQVQAKRNIGVLLHFAEEVYIEMQSGMAAIIIGSSPDSLDEFSVHRFLRLKAGVYFAMVAVTPEIIYTITAGKGYQYTSYVLETPYKFNRILPRISIEEILGYYYSVRNSGYQFKGEAHEYYELTFVDRGSLITEVDGVIYELGEKDLLIYGPGQFHTQSIKHGSSCSYVTVIFSMNSVMDNIGEVENTLILNQVFHYNKTIYTLIKKFVQESSSQIPYMNSLMLCLLQETVIRLLQLPFTNANEPKEEKPVSNINQHYQDEIMDKILGYIDETICEPLTIAEICQTFSLSRSSLQILFKENMDTTPKKYINNLKLEKSRQMISEEKYTISEIALMLGFNSIHYFSRAFTGRYHISPSEYSKQLLKL